MAFFLALQHTYTSVSCALFKGDTLIEQRDIHKHEASKQLVVVLDQLLQNNNLALSDLAFIAANHGPGPFTTMRVVITTVNSISFATGIPLLAVDGFDAFFYQYQDDKYPHTIALFNAFSHDVYAAGQDHGTIVRYGAQNYESFLHKINARYPNTTIRFMGDGALLYRDAIQTIFGSNAVLPEPMAQYCSINAIGQLAWHAWNKNPKIEAQIVPLYLKSYSARMQ